MFIVSAVPFGPARRLADALENFGLKARLLAEKVRTCDPAAVAEDHMPFMDAAREVKRRRDELMLALEKQAVGEALADLAQADDLVFS